MHAAAVRVIETTDVHGPYPREVVYVCQDCGEPQVIPCAETPEAIRRAIAQAHAAGCRCRECRRETR